MSVNYELTKNIGLMKSDASFVRKGILVGLKTNWFKTIFEYFFNFKGIVGDWKNHFSFETNQKIDTWIGQHLAGTDLTFKTQLDIDI